MRSKAPLHVSKSINVIKDSLLHAVKFFQDSGGDAISHSKSDVLSVLDAARDPVVGDHIVIAHVDQVHDGNIQDGHTEPTLGIILVQEAYVSVDGVFLEISVHFGGKRGGEAVRLISFAVNTAKLGPFVVVDVHSRG
jgi:hypothetical protein